MLAQLNATIWISRVLRHNGPPIGRVTAAPLPRPDRAGFKTRGATLAMLTNSHPLQKGHIQPCLRDKEDVKTPLRERQDAVSLLAWKALTCAAESGHANSTMIHVISRYTKPLTPRGFARLASYGKSNDVRP
jgi:hypothetical protein